MENVKKCPECGKEIKAAAKKCRYCGVWFEENRSNIEPPKPNFNNQNTFNFEINTGNAITIKDALVEPVKITFRNIGWILLTEILYYVTSWIPYINIGTTIAISNLPSELARGKKLSPFYIFDSKYRKYMGEYFAMFGNLFMILVVSIPFMGIPFWITYYGWSFAPLLLVDKEVNTSESFTLSTKLTYGYKLKMFLVDLIVEFAVVILCVCTLTTIIVPIIVVLFYIMMRPAMIAIFYKKLVVDKE